MKIKSSLMRISILLVAAWEIHSAPAQSWHYPPEATLAQVKARIAQAPKAHPRLLATRAELDALRQSVDQDPWRHAVAKAVLAQADQMLTIDPVVRKLQGRRLLDQSRRCLKRTVTLSMAYHLTGDLKYVRRCEKEMLAAASFSDWNPSHFLDTAEMTFALALGYDWLYQQLKPASRAAIRQAIIQKGVRLPFETRHKGWVRARNNWGQVCHAGLTAGALAVLEDEPELAARTVHNALHNVTYAMAAYAPKGSYPEGPGYWSYGTSFNVLLIGVLESALQTDFGLSRAPGFDLTGQYLDLVTGPSGLFFNYSDGGAGRGLQPALFWFASRYHRPDWLLGERERWETSLAKLRPSQAVSGSGRLMPLALLWLRAPQKITSIQMPLHWQSEGHTPIAIHRSSWTEPNATFVGLKAGSPSASHGQMDIGSFVLDADGRRWAMDLGAEGYYGIESRGMNLWSRAQTSDRWTIFRQSNAGHNTLVIDGQLQRASGAGKIIAFSENHAFAHTVVDLTGVYAGQAQAVLRGVALLPSGEVLVQDQLTGLKPGSEVRWGMITPATPEQTAGSQLQLKLNEAHLQLSLLSPPSATWQIIDTAKPRHPWDSPNRGTRMAAFQVIAPASGKVTLAVLATPGTCRQSVQANFKLRPLEDWPKP